MNLLDQFRKRLIARQNNPRSEKPVIITCFGDSVTHGVFEVYNEKDKTLVFTYDAKSTYHARLKELFDIFYPAAAVSIVNAGVNGDTAVNALARVNRDVLDISPDLCILCFGLNDSLSGMPGLQDFRLAISEILDRLSGIPLIIMTPCMMNTKICRQAIGETFVEAAEKCMKIQTGGVLKAYVEVLREQAHIRGILLCDEYARFERWAASGIDTDQLLANGINHPLREIHYLWAHDLFKLLAG